MASPRHTPVRIEREGNPLWPLPHDYHERDSEYQRVARVNASSLWLLPDATTEEAVRSWAFFREYYLLPDHEASFDPGFYDPPILPPAVGHYHLVGWLHQFNFLAVGAPRYYGKSVVKRSIFMHRLVTGFRYKINSIVPKEDFGVKEVHYIKTQLETNARIRADFGDLRGTKGVSIWNNHNLILQNGCEFQMLSIDGKIRGSRGHLNVVDDPEFDEDYRTRSAQVVQRLRETLLKVVIPMGGLGSKVLWLGTMVSKQALLYLIVSTDTLKGFERIEKGGRWFKVNIPAIDAQGNNAYPEKYTPDFIAEKRDTMGESFFRTEFMGDPRSEEDSPLTVIPHLNEWRFKEGRKYLLEPISPFEGGTLVQYRQAGHTASEADFSNQEVDLSKHLSGMTRILTVDYAEGLTSQHDYSAIVVGGLDRRNDLWIWDAWQDRVRSLKLADRVWQLARKYRVNIIAVESVATQIEVFRLIREYVLSQQGLTPDWTPQMLPLKYPAHLSKSDRIAALEWRFNQGKIKLPPAADLIGDSTKHIRTLYDQIRNFTPDLRGLPTDDLIDALAMMQYVVRGSNRQLEARNQEVSVVEQANRGNLYVGTTGIHIGTTKSWRDFTVGEIDAIMKAHHKAEESRLAGLADVENPPEWLMNQTFASGMPLGEVLL